MTLNFTIEHDDSVVRVTTTGLFDFLKAYEMWEAIVAACKTHDCYKILGLSSLAEPTPSMDAYDHMSLFQAVGVTPRHRIAWVAENPALVDKLRLAETVLRNRASFNIQVFEKADEAKHWLAAGNGG